jgi:tetratricopeptide (TPR) repeat protein
MRGSVDRTITSVSQGYYGLALSYCGRGWEEAREAAPRALRLSPRDPFSAVYDGIAAYAQFVGRNHEEAMRLAREAIRRRVDFVGARRVLAAAGMRPLTPSRAHCFAPPPRLVGGAAARRNPRDAAAGAESRPRGWRWQ